MVLPFPFASAFPVASSLQSFCCGWVQLSCAKRRKFVARWFPCTSGCQSGFAGLGGEAKSWHKACLEGVVQKQNRKENP